jgi:predicted 3-demethylubiquinone-9 3-methyltransferase (glyoxalase superfamily)
MQKITPYLWFDNNAEEAIDYYVAIFKDAKVTNVMRLGGKVLSLNFQLFGQEFIALNGGPLFKFSEAISFFVKCDSQEEIDELWRKLSEGGEEQRCGWLKDRFGLSWQIIPPILGKLLQDPDPEKSKRVMDAMLKMNKIDIRKLQDAYDAKA